MTTGRPNLLIFMTDQQQAQVIDPAHPCRTPNVERLAADGVRFTRAYPPMAHCSPARASMMTGLYPSQHGVYNNIMNEQAFRRSPYPGTEMFSDKLKEAGYDLYFSGKWHVSDVDNPRDRGWEELMVFAGAGTQMGITREGFRQDQARYAAELAQERRTGQIKRPGWGDKQLYGSTDDPDYRETRDYKAVQRALAQLDRLREADNPWCMYIGVNGPHDPFIIPEKYARLYDPDSIPLPPSYADTLLDKPGVYRRMRRIFDQLSEQEVRESIAHYWGYCTMVDDMFGEVLDALERNGQREHTLVLFLSDHGEHAGAHGLYCKGISMFDEGYRVPFVIGWPGRIQEPGRNEDAFVSLTDVAPTLLEASGSAALSRCAGRSLMPFLQGERPAQWRDSLYAQCNGVELFYTSRMVQTDRYKFVYHGTDRDELYDLVHDPYELRNMAEDPEMAPVMREMYRRMWNHAYAYEDTIFNQYVTVATADYGPGLFGADSRKGME